MITCISNIFLFKMKQSDLWSNTKGKHPETKIIVKLEVESDDRTAVECEMSSDKMKRKEEKFINKE